MNSKKEIKIICLIIFFLIIIDQITKFILWNTNLDVTNNEQNLRYIFLTAIILVTMVRFIFSKNSFIKLSTKIVVSFAIAGGASNLIDRIIFKDVRNYIDITNFANINLAYIYIAVTWVGMAVILTRDTIGIVKDRKRKLKEARNGEKNDKKDNRSK